MKGDVRINRQFWRGSENYRTFRVFPHQAKDICATTALLNTKDQLYGEKQQTTSCWLTTRMRSLGCLQTNHNKEIA